MPEESIPQNVTWPLKPHTYGKHLILKYYLGGWLPILSRYNPRIVFIDGFAGPGEYEGREPGSPLIALKCIREFKQDPRFRHSKGVEIVCVFIEKEEDRANHLERLLEREKLRGDPDWFVSQGAFDEEMTRTLDYFEKEGTQLAPAFVMVDPFGVKGFSMQLIERILRNEKSECMISFMYKNINRYRTTPQYERLYDQIFGTTDWQRCREMPLPRVRKQFLHDLFRDQLKKHGARFVVPFELWEGNSHVYTVFFTSGSLDGCNLMKYSMWRAAPMGNFAFSGRAGRLSLLLRPNTNLLKSQLKKKFGNEETPIEIIEEFVMGDETDFHKSHLRRDTLRPLEREGRITVIRPHGGNGFPNNRGVKVRFH